MEKSGIFCKLDWFQAVFNDVDFDYVLNYFLEMGVSFDDPVFNSCFDRKYGVYDHHLVYECNGVQISANYAEVLENSDNVFNTVYSRIFLIIPGQGLEYLRNFYSEPDEVDRILRKQPELNEYEEPIWHVTRCDFAFDFVNYKYDIYECTRSELDVFKSVNGTVQIKGIRRPISYTVRSGSEKTIYIGKARSHRLLRIYDKKLEQTKNGVLLSLPDDSINYDIDSWNRIELQCRDNWAHYYLYGAHDYMQILRGIYDYYAFIDQQGIVSDFWQNLFDWVSIPLIIQNAKFAKYKLSKNVLNNQYENAKKVICAFLAFYGKEFVFNDLIDCFNNFFVSDHFYSRMTRKLLRRIDCLNDFKNDNRNLDGAYIQNIGGRSILKLK